MGEAYEALTHGCYVVTTVLDGRRYGMTCSWATQIESDKVMLCLGGQSATGKAIRRSRVFGVNVLTLMQRELAIHFGQGHSDEVDKFAGVETEAGETGVPLLPSSLKTMECELENDALGGYEHLFVGRIVRFRETAATEPALLLSHIDAPR